MIEQCEKCKHKEILNGGIVGCLYMGADCRKGEMFEPYTNADRIRAMSDELLASQMVVVVEETIKVLTNLDVPDEVLNEVRSQILERLKQPAEEE